MLIDTIRQKLCGLIRLDLVAAKENLNREADHAQLQLNLRKRMQTPEMKKTEMVMRRN
jgi:hypothetical protein